MSKNFRKYSLIDRLKKKVIIQPMYRLGVKLNNKCLIDKATNMAWDLIDKYVVVTTDEGSVN